MSVDIHFAAYVSVSEMASIGSPRDARNPFTSATRPASEASREAAYAWPAGIAKPLPMAAIARIVLTNLRKAHLLRVERPTKHGPACMLFAHVVGAATHRNESGDGRVTCPLQRQTGLIRAGNIGERAPGGRRRAGRRGSLVR